MNVALINPNIVTQKNDLFGSGIPYLPLDIAYLAAQLRKKKIKVQVIDSFGANPFKIRTKGNYFYQGLTNKEIIKRLKKRVDLIVVYASRAVMHSSAISIIKSIKKKIKAPLVVIENTQAVTSYAINKVAEAFFDAGADYILIGEPEVNFENFLRSLKSKKNLHQIHGLIFKHKGKINYHDKRVFIKDLDRLEFPAWDLIPIQNYWKIGYAHAPLTSKRYLPLMTSRGCPYACKFCVTSSTNKRQWRARSAKNVVDEIESFSKRFKVNEFHLEDLNPTIQKERMQNIAKEIIKRGLKINWKIGSGTKIETLDKKTISLMAKSGCSYISISPESGSNKILKLMDKQFNHELGLQLVKHIHSLGIKTQACFVLGFPGETSKDRILTEKYAKQLAKAGIDEIALFIITPSPGSSLYEQFQKEYTKIEELTFSPTWRKDYKELHNFRSSLYLNFLFWKMIYNPLSLLSQLMSLLTGNFKTKMEMTIYRALKLRYLAAKRG